MRFFKIMFVVGCMFLSCKKTSESGVSPYLEEVVNLTNTELKKEYLKAIFREDQAVRNAEDEYAITKKYGRDSQEFKNHLHKMNETDLINLRKIETYLDYFGYPDKAAMGEIAALTPLIVVHHQIDYEAGVKNFKYLYSGYLEGDIKEASFSMYLARMYNTKKGERLDMGGPYQEQDKINLLIEKLGLEKKK